MKNLLLLIIAVSLYAGSPQCNKAKKEFVTYMTSTTIAYYAKDSIRIESQGLLAIRAHDDSIKHCGYKKGAEAKAVNARQELQLIVFMAKMKNANDRLKKESYKKLSEDKTKIYLPNNKG